MREFLTALAAILILVLLVALVGPLFITWEDRRAIIDARLSELVGMPVRSEGEIRFGLLPAPTARFGSLLIGDQGAEATTARIDDLSIELDLLPFLQRQIRITQIRAGAVDGTVGTDENGSPALPLPTTGAQNRWPLAIEKLVVERGSLRLVRPDGRRTSIAPITLEASADDLAGPWRVQGSAAGIPLRFSTGEMAGPGQLRVLAAVGGAAHPRFEFDGVVGEEISGNAKLSMGPPVQPADSGAPVPVIMTGTMKGTSRELAISGIKVDVADGPASLRFEGEGNLVLAGEPSLSLNFNSKFIDADAFLLSPPGQAFLRGSGRGFGAWPIPTRIGLKIDTLTLGNEETGALDAQVEVAEFGAALKRLSGVLPGQSKVTFTGADGGSTSHLFGRLAIDSANPEALAGFLVQLNGPATAARLSGGQPFKLETDLIVTREVVAARGFDWSSAAGRVTGNLRYTPPETEGGRARLDAQVVSSAFDLATLPALDGLRRTLSDVDFDMSLDARNLRYTGSGQPAGGRIQGRLNADAEGLTVATLDISELAGASARASGRITNQGDGRIDGTVSAGRIGSLLSLAGKIWGSDSLVAELPKAVGEAPLAGAFSIIASNTSADRALVASLNATSNSMRVQGESAFSRDDKGALEGLAQGKLTLSAANSTDLLRLASLDAQGAPAAPGEAVFTLERLQGLGLTVSMAAQDANWRIETISPIPLRGRVETQREGQFRVSVADASPWLSAWQLVPPDPRNRRPAALDVKVRPAAGRWAVEPEGRIGDVPFKAGLTINPSSRTISGNLDIGSGSLPALIAWAGLVPSAPAQPGTIWSIARFPAAQPMPFNAEIEIKAANVDLGQGRTGTNGSATLLIGPESLSLRPFRLDHQGIELSGELSATRQGGRAALAGEIAVSDLLALSPTARTILDGKMPARIRFGTSGETPTIMVANLSGGGQATWEAAAVNRLAPNAPFTVANAGAGAEGNLPSNEVARRDLGRVLDQAPFVPQERRKEAPATITGGVMRIGPIIAETQESRLNLQLTFDLRTLALEGRASLQATASPTGWIGGAPQIALAWRGQAGQPTLAREIDPGPLVNGLAALRLSKEVEKIEQMEADDRERAFFNRRLRAERERNQPPPAPAPTPAPTPAPVQPPAAVAPLATPPPALPDSGTGDAAPGTLGNQPLLIVPPTPQNSAPGLSPWSLPPLPPPVNLQPQ